MAEEEEEGNSVKGPVGTGEENHVAAEGVRQMKQEHPQVVVERQSLLPLLVADTSMVVQRQQQHRHGHNIVVVVVLQENQENMEEEEEEVVALQPPPHVVVIVVVERGVARRRLPHDVTRWDHRQNIEGRQVEAEQQQVLAMARILVVVVVA